jgi:hypothetical protein
MEYKMEKYGFVYIWRDRKYKRYYVGSHWGYEDDGYVCSSPWMIKAYKKRPEDFKRKILSRIYSSRSDLLQSEYRYLNMIKESEIKIRYYNLNIKSTAHWSAFNYAPTIIEKISIKTKEAMQRPDVRSNYEEGLNTRNNRSSDIDVREKRRQSMVKTMAEKFPEENRRKPLSDDERKEYYSQKGKNIWANRSEEQIKEIGSKISNGLKGKQNRLGQTNSAEHRKKISDAQKGIIHKRHKIVIDDVTYDSTHKAAESLDISVATINRRLKDDKYTNYIRLG